MPLVSILKGIDHFVQTGQSAWIGSVLRTVKAKMGDIPVIMNTAAQVADDLTKSVSDVYKIQSLWNHPDASRHAIEHEAAQLSDRFAPATIDALGKMAKACFAILSLR
jgi:hypothetical protein